MKKSFRICLVIFAIIVFLIFFLFFTVRHFASSQNDFDSQSVRIEISYGQSVSSIADDLYENNLIKNKYLFYYAVRFPFLCKIFFPEKKMPDEISLKSGIYTISKNDGICEIINKLSSGNQEYIKVSIPEGLTISKIAGILEENEICSKNEFILLCKSSEFAKKFNIPFETCEGYLFPDTYFFTPKMDEESVATIMIENFYEKLMTIQGISEKTNEEIGRIVNLASIVEREYRVSEEAPLIASVFKNRLEKNIGLYSCATVEYIITEIQGKPHPERILISDTKIDNPYNTYKWAGLPPGPISNPGMTALDAAANTPETSYYYFQIADQNEGRHVFTTNFEDHILEHNLYTKKSGE